MKVKDAIKLLSVKDPDAELIIQSIDPNATFTYSITKDLIFWNSHGEGKEYSGKNVVIVNVSV